MNIIWSNPEELEYNGKVNLLAFKTYLQKPRILSYYKL